MGFNEEFSGMKHGDSRIEASPIDWGKVPEGLLPNQQIFSEHDLINSGKGYTIHKMIEKNVRYQINKGNPIVSVTLSRAKYDTYELWLRKMGFQTEENCMYPISCCGKEVLRSTDSRMEDITINYRGVIDGAVNLEYLEKNMENLNINVPGQAINNLDSLSKNWKNKSK